MRRKSTQKLESLPFTRTVIIKQSIFVTYSSYLDGQNSHGYKQIASTVLVTSAFWFIATFRVKIYQTILLLLTS